MMPTDRPHPTKHAVNSAWGLGLLLAVVVITRLYTMEPVPSGLDSGNFLLGMHSYSVLQERPHAPGYPVLIGLASSLQMLGLKAHTALWCWSLLFSCAAILALYRLARIVLPSGTSMLACMLLAANPLFWYNGSVTETYTFDALLAPCLIGATLVIRSPRWWLLLGVGIGLALGLRPTSVVLLAPVLVLTIRSRRMDASPFHLAPALLRMAGGAVIGTALWLIPAVIVEGGWYRYAQAVAAMADNSSGTPAGNTAAFLSTMVFAIGPAVLLLPWMVRHLAPPLRRLAVWWTLPSVMFFCLVHYQKGYALLIVPMLCLAAAVVLQRWSHPWRWGSVLAGVWMVTFLFVPYRAPLDAAALPATARGNASTADVAVSRLFSAYLPSADRIRANTSAVLTAEALVQQLPASRDTTIVVVDPVARLHVQARVLQARAVDARSANDIRTRHGQPVIYAEVERGSRGRGLTLYPGISKVHNVHVDTGVHLTILTRTSFAASYRSLRPTTLAEADGFTLLGIGAPPEDVQALADELFTAGRQR